METNRKKVFSGTSQVQAMGFKNALESADIEFYELDKTDSSFKGLLDDIQIYVDVKDEDKALTILKSLNF